MPWRVCGGQRTMVRCGSPLSTLWTLRIELRSLGLSAGACICWAVMATPMSSFLNKPSWSDPKGGKNSFPFLWDSDKPWNPVLGAERPSPAQRPLRSFQPWPCSRAPTVCPLEKATAPGEPALAHLIFLLCFTLRYLFSHGLWSFAGKLLIPYVCC